MKNDDKACFSDIYVSINHGIFLCYNCASIHQSNYGVEISFIKRINDESKIIGTDGKKELKISKWTYTQLRVLIISGGNKGFADYMEQYDLMDANV